MTDADPPISSEPTRPAPRLSYATPEKSRTPDPRMFLTFPRFEAFAIGGALSAVPLVLVFGVDAIGLPFLLGFLQAVMLGLATQFIRVIVELAPPRERYRFYLFAGVINGAAVQLAVVSLWLLLDPPPHGTAKLSLAAFIAFVVITSITAVLIWPVRPRLR